MKVEDRVIEYYERCEMDYKLVWKLNSAHAIHYGYWDQGTHDLVSALLNMNRVVAERAGITASMRILDAGCGVGGTSVYLAKKYGCDVTGITLSAKQVVSAQKNAEHLGVSTKTHFYQKNFLDTGFPDHTFDVVIATDSVCHTDDKEGFVREAKRVLKPGGKLLVTDFFRTQEKFAPHDEEILDQWSKGWGYYVMDTPTGFEQKLKSAQFSNIIVEDETAHIEPSAVLLYKQYLKWRVVGWLAELVKIRKSIHAKNRLTAYYQYEALKKGLWKYVFFSANA